MMLQGSILNFLDLKLDINVQYELNIEEKTIEIKFTNLVINEAKLEEEWNKLWLIDSNGRKITLLNCNVVQNSMSIQNPNQCIGCKINFLSFIYDIHIDTLDSVQTEEFYGVIGSDPVPMMYMISAQNDVFFENNNVKIDVIPYETNKRLGKIIIQSTSGLCDFSKLNEILFNLIDIYALCLGFYPYIDHIGFKYGEKDIKVYQMYIEKYIKGNSFAHWSKVLFDRRKFNLKEALTQYYKMFSDNNMVIDVLENVVHAKSVFTNIVVSYLIQCVEGYMKKWHPSEKFPDKLKKEIVAGIIEKIQSMTFEVSNTCVRKEDIVSSCQGLLGYINKPSLSECLKSAFNFNEYTEILLKQEKDKGYIDIFIAKSKGTRNQFSHMSPQSDTFSSAEELILAQEKYTLLLRLLILSDLNIQIDKSNLVKMVTDINEMYGEKVYPPIGQIEV